MILNKVIIFTSIFLIINLKTVFGDEPKIVIVGAGASGIAAAAKLLENGINDITILEAEDRIGGRVFTVKFGDYWVDLGGQWVHGEKNNVVFDLVWPMGLLEHSDESRYEFIFYSTSKRSLLSPEQKKNISDFYSAIENSPDDFCDMNKVESIGEVYRKAMEYYFKSHPDIAEYSNQLIEYFALIAQSLDSALSWDDIVAESTWGADMGDKVINWKERGYSTILDILMKKYPDISKELPVIEKTRLNTEVNKIDYTDNNAKVKVHTVNGDIYEADHVIVTPSLGVLKATHNTLFEPKLSDEKTHFIEKYGFGSVAKIYLLFENQWWIKENVKGYLMSILWNEEDKNERKNDPDKEWQLYILGFLQVEHKPNLLCLWLSGKGAIEVEKIPESCLMEQINELLQFFSLDYNVTLPTKMLRTNWYSNDHFRGTYSYYSIEAARNHANKTSFIEPIPYDNPKILFAGEASDIESYATVHGAISAGWREANRLINLHKKSNV